MLACWACALATQLVPLGFVQPPNGAWQGISIQTLAVHLLKINPHPFSHLSQHAQIHKHPQTDKDSLKGGCLRISSALLWLKPPSGSSNTSVRVGAGSRVVSIVGLRKGRGGCLETEVCLGQKLNTAPSVFLREKEGACRRRAILRSYKCLIMVIQACRP